MLYVNATSGTLSSSALSEYLFVCTSNSICPYDRFCEPACGFVRRCSLVPRHGRTCRPLSFRGQNRGRPCDVWDSFCPPSHHQHCPGRVQHGRVFEIGIAVDLFLRKAKTKILEPPFHQITILNNSLNIDFCINSVKSPLFYT